MYKVFTLLFFTMIFFSCKKTKHDNNFSTNNYVEKWSLMDNGLIKFPLDSTISKSSITSIQYSTFHDKSYFSFLNEHDNSLNYFDLDDINKNHKVRFEYEGPNGVGFFSLLTGHYLKNLDSIYIYTNESSQINLLNSKGELLSKKNVLLKDGEVVHKNVFVTKSNVIHLSNGKLYLPCSVRPLEQYKQERIILEVDEGLSSTSYKVNFPEVYDTGFFGSTFNYVPSIAGPKKGNNVATFPMSAGLYEIDTNGNIINAKYAPSKHFDKIEPMKGMDKSYELNLNSRDWTRERHYSYSTPNFSKILYDKYRDLYYRIVHIRPSLEAVKLGSTTPDFSVIIFDKELNKVGETDIMDNTVYDPVMMSVFKEGLAIARKDLYKENDAELAFSIFTLENINE